jgi:predicted nuclease of predicted toxin-antitoxin system
MKFLIDENLPPAFAVWLVANGHDAVHVVRANLRGASDAAIAAYAIQSDRIIVTRDSDFDLPASRLPALRVLRLTVGNCKNAALVAWISPLLDHAISALETEPFVVID